MIVKDGFVKKQNNNNNGQILKTLDLETANHSL